MKRVEGTKNLTRAQSARIARRIWHLLDDERMKDPIKTTIEIETTMKKAQNFSPAGCVCIFFSENLVCAVQGVGMISIPIGIIALQSLKKYAYQTGEVRPE